MELSKSECAFEKNNRVDYRPEKRIEKSHICTEPVSLNYVCLRIEQ